MSTNRPPVCGIGAYNSKWKDTEKVQIREYIDYSLQRAWFAIFRGQRWRGQLISNYLLLHVVYIFKKFKLCVLFSEGCIPYSWWRGLILTLLHVSIINHKHEMHRLLLGWKFVAGLRFQHKNRRLWIQQRVPRRFSAGDVLWQSAVCSTWTVSGSEFWCHCEVIAVH